MRNTPRQLNACLECDLLHFGLFPISTFPTSPLNTHHFFNRKATHIITKKQTTTEPSWTSVSHNPYFVHWYVIQAVGTEDQNMVEPIRIISWNLGSSKSTTEKVCLFSWTLKPQLFPAVLGSHWEHYCHTLSSHSARTSPGLKDFSLASQTHSLFIFFGNSLFIKLQTSPSQNTRLWQLEDQLS